MERFFKRPWLIVAVIALITVFFALQLPRARLDNNNFRFVPEKNSARLISKYIDATFGSQVVIMVGLERKYGTVLDADFLKQVRAYGKRIEEINIVDSVTSITSSDYITGTGDSIVVEPLLAESFTGTSAEVAEVKNRLLSWDLYRRALVSDDFTSTQLLVSLNIPSEQAGDPATVAGYMKVKSIAAEMFPSGTTVYVTGIPVFSANINEAVRRDLILLIPLVILVVLLVLLFSFKRLIGIVLPLLTVVIATIWSIGAMPLFGVKLSILSTVLPVILVAVGSAYGIHVVTHYLEDTAVKKKMTKDEHEQLVFALMRKIGSPVFLAALTTFAGFSSFCFTSVLPIREFGYFSSFGVVASYLVAVTLIPAIFLIRGPKTLREKKTAHAAGTTAHDEYTDPMTTAIADSFASIVRKKHLVLFISAACVLVSVVGISKLVIDNVMVEYFKPYTDIVRSDAFIRKHFGGSKIVSIVVASDTKGGVLRPDVLVAMDGLSSYLEKNVPEVGKVTSFADLIKRINQVYNADESPDGIKPTAAAVPSAPNGNEAFGFGDFGSFESALPADSSVASGAASLEPASPAASERTVNLKELVASLDSAVSSASGQGLSANDLVRELRRAVNYEGASYYEIPADPARYGKKTEAELQQLISNYLVLLSGSIKSFANDPLEPTAVRMNVQLRTVGQIDSDRAMKEIDDYIAANFPKDVKVTIGGTALIEKSLNLLVVQSQLSSVIISLLMVFLIIAVSYRSVIAGLIGLTPLSITIFMNFAIMGAFGIKLNIGTALVASVSVGIGIDYTIHYLAAYHREYLATGGQGNFLWRTFTASGKAILINAVSVGAGFAVLMLSQFKMLADLGLLIAFTMASSAIVSLTVLPVILSIVNPKFIRKEI